MADRRSKWPKTRRITEHTYEAALDRAVDVVFEYATYVKQWTWAELAHNARLCYTTVYRLGSRETRLPRWQTFWKLATAVGLTLEFVDPASGRVVHPRKLKAA